MDEILQKKLNNGREYRRMELIEENGGVTDSSEMERVTRGEIKR